MIPIRLYVLFALFGMAAPAVTGQSLQFQTANIGLGPYHWDYFFQGDTLKAWSYHLSPHADAFDSRDLRSMKMTSRVTDLKMGPSKSFNNLKENAQLAERIIQSLRSAAESGQIDSAEVEQRIDSIRNGSMPVFSMTPGEVPQSHKPRLSIVSFDSANGQVRVAIPDSLALGSTFSARLYHNGNLLVEKTFAEQQRQFQLRWPEQARPRGSWLIRVVAYEPNQSYYGVFLHLDGVGWRLYNVRG